MVVEQIKCHSHHAVEYLDPEPFAQCMWLKAGFRAGDSRLQAESELTEACDKNGFFPSTSSNKRCPKRYFGL